MELRPIPGIRGLGPASTSRIEREVEPPIALDPSSRMEDDAYNGSGQGAERGLEEEDSVAEGTTDMTDASSTSVEPDPKFNFFA
ncbi:MAG: hypothetical protein WBX19_11610 [Terracidiphilus sp.]